MILYNVYKQDIGEHTELLQSICVAVESERSCIYPLALHIMGGAQTSPRTPPTYTVNLRGFGIGKASSRVYIVFLDDHIVISYDPKTGDKTMYKNSTLLVSDPNSIERIRDFIRMLYNDYTSTC